MHASYRVATHVALWFLCAVQLPSAHAVLAPHSAAAGLLPTLLTDPSGDQGSGPEYADMLGAGMTNAGTDLIVAQKLRGDFPPFPPDGFPGYSWRFDTDLNTNTGYRQFDYIGIDWEILLQPAPGGWTVNKWSPAGGLVPVPSATVLLQHTTSGDVIAVRFPAEEIGRPPYLDWIAWNGVTPEWQDVTPDATVAWWER